MHFYERLVSFLSSIGKGIIELVFYSFLWLPVAFYSLGLASTLVWLLLLLISYSVYQFFGERKKIAYFTVVLVALCSTTLIYVVCSLLFTSTFNALTVILFMLFSLAFNISGFRQFTMSFKESFNFTIMGLSMLGHLLLQLLKVTWITEIASINGVLICLGIACILLNLFITNERMLDDQQKLLGKSTIQRQALKINRLILSIISIIIIGILLFRQWQERLEQYIKAFIDWFLNLFNSPPKEDTAELPEQQVNQFPFGESKQNDTPWLLELLEKLFVFLAYVAITIVIIAVLYLLFRLVMVAFNKLISFLKLRAGMLEDEELTYIDEVEEIERVSRKLTRRRLFTKANRRINWTSLNKQQKCQYLYILFIRKAEQLGHVYIKDFTVGEQIGYIKTHFKLEISQDKLELLRAVYNEARYGVERDNLNHFSEQQLDELYGQFISK